LPFEIARRKPDVFHSPGLEPPIFCRSPWVQTLHDVTPLTFEHPFFRAERTRWRRVFARMERATIIVAVSRSTADAAVRLLDIDPERIEVIPNGVDRRFHPRTEPYRPETPYLLSVGVYGPHKGYAEAFAVIDMLARRGYPHRLKIVGTLNDWRRGQITRLLASVEHRDRVDLLGFVDDEQLCALYRDAAALIMTSRSEGFGLPIVEAMASGTPVLAFANTSLPEVAGDAGLLVQDGDVAGIADRVAEVLDDPSLALRLRETGLARAREFDWKAVADRYAEVYLRAAAGKR